MKTITIEVEDSYWLEILKLLKKFPIKIIEEKNSEVARMKLAVGYRLFYPPFMP